MEWIVCLLLAGLVSLLFYKRGYNDAWEELCRDYIVIHKTSKFRPIKVILGGTLINDEDRKDLFVHKKYNRKEKKHAKKSIQPTRFNKKAFK